MIEDERRKETGRSADVRRPIEEQKVELCGYRLQPQVPTIVPAPVRRDWMDQTVDRFAPRCLPMMIANQAGWFILDSVPVRLLWNGGRKAGDLAVNYLGAPPQNPPVVSYFGHGVATWRIPILFRTPAGIELLVRGPANCPKAHVYPLEGIVETSWSIATFTMNWQVMTAFTEVVFQAGDPICMIVPVRVNDLELVAPVSRSVFSDPALAEAYQAWFDKRMDFISSREPGTWEKDYVRGRVGDLHAAGEHRTRLKLAEFREE